MINHIGLSWGKDSTALLGWALHESGYSRESLRFSFCDTENEYEEVYDQIRKLDKIVQDSGCLPIRWLRANNSKWTWNRWPLFLALAARARFCTEQLKIIPTIKYLEELWLDGHEVLAHSGVRGSESHERSLMSEYGTDALGGCKVRRPLLKWSISDVWAAHKKWKLPINALYFTGCKRVGCRLCCMSNKRDVRLTAKTRPDVITMYAIWERIVGLVGLNGEPLSQGKMSAHGSGFFPATTVPALFRSIKGLVRKRDSKNGKKGEVYSAANIYDVVEWSKTARGGAPVLGFYYEEEDFNADDAALPCQSGYCE